MRVISGVLELVLKFIIISFIIGGVEMIYVVILGCGILVVMCLIFEVFVWFGLCL